jgi:hypothetical protein
MDKEEIELYWTSSKIISNMVDELRVHCSHKNECDWIGQRQFLPTHLAVCAFHPKPCKWQGCSFESISIEMHEENCDYRIIQCELCKENVMHSAISVTYN